MSKFNVTAQLDEGLRVKCSARDFDIILDEPKNLGGTDLGMTPVEALLAALGACKVIVGSMYAKQRKINLNDIRVELEGDLAKPKVGDKDPRIGFTKIVSSYYIDADNTDEEIAEFVKFIDKSCPVADTLIYAPEMESVIK